MRYVSVDVETTGLNPNRCGIIEFAAVIADSADRDGTILAQFLRVLRTGHDVHWDDVASTMHSGWYPQALQEDYTIPPHALMSQFALWLFANKMDPMKIVAAGKNFSSFDLQFLNKLDGYDKIVRFRHRSLDPMMLFFRPDEDDSLPDTDCCMKRAKVFAAVNHRAMVDAQIAVKLLHTGWYK